MGYTTLFDLNAIIAEAVASQTLKTAAGFGEQDPYAPADDDDWMEFGNVIENLVPQAYEKIMGAVEKVPNMTSLQLTNLTQLIDRAMGEERKRQVRERIVMDPRQANINTPQFLNNLLNFVGQRLQAMMTVNNGPATPVQAPNAAQQILPLVKTYLAKIAPLGPDGKVRDFDPSKITPPPPQLMQDWVGFSQAVQQLSAKEEVASRLLLAIQDASQNQQQQQQMQQKGVNAPAEKKEGEDEWDAKMKQYEKLPTRPLSTGAKGKILDSFFKVTDTARAYVDKNRDSIAKEGKNPLAGTSYAGMASKYPQDAEDAHQKAVMSALGPYMEVAESGKHGLHKLDYKDGRLRFFANFPRHLEAAAKAIAAQGGPDILGELAQNKVSLGSPTPEQEAQGYKSLNKSPAAYAILQQNAEPLIAYMGQLIQSGNPDVTAWVKKVTKNNLLQMFYQKIKDKTGQFEYTDPSGKSSEVSGVKGKASDNASNEADGQQTSQAIIQWYTNVLQQVKRISDKVSAHYRQQKEYVKADVLDTMISVSLGQLNKLSQSGNLTKSLKAAGIISVGPDGNFAINQGAEPNFNSLIDLNEVYSKLQEVGQKKIDLKDQIDQALKSGASAEDIAKQLKVTPQFVVDTAAQDHQTIKNQYFSPSEADVKASMQEQHDLRIKTLELAQQHPEWFARGDDVLAAKRIYQELNLGLRGEKIHKTHTVYEPNQIAQVIEGLYVNGKANPTAFVQRQQQIAAEYNPNNPTAVKELQQKIVKRHRYNVQYSIGENFGSWADTLVEISKEIASEGLGGSSYFPVEVFVNLVNVNNKWRNAAKPTYTGATPKYWEAIGKPIPQDVQDNISRNPASPGRGRKTLSEAIHEMIYAETMGTIRKMAALSEKYKKVNKFASASAKNWVKIASDIADASIKRIAYLRSFLG